MMNAIVYAAVGFVAGAITGGIIFGRVIAKDFSKQIESLEEQNRNLTDEVVKLRDQNYDIRENKLKEEESKLENYHSAVRAYVPENDDEEDELIFAGTKVERITIEDRSDEIKRIDEGRYNDALNYMDSEQLTYFQEDGTLTNDLHDIIHSPEQVVGSEIMDIIDETKNDILYALDEKLNKIYEIDVDHDSSYTRDILGVC